jgi:ribosomal protein S27AE
MSCALKPECPKCGSTDVAYKLGGNAVCVTCVTEFNAHTGTILSKGFKCQVCDCTEFDVYSSVIVRRCKECGHKEGENEMEESKAEEVVEQCPRCKQESLLACLDGAYRCELCSYVKFKDSIEEDDEKGEDEMEKKPKRIVCPECGERNAPDEWVCSECEYSLVDDEEDETGGKVECLVCGCFNKSDNVECADCGVDLNARTCPWCQSDAYSDNQCDYVCAKCDCNFSIRDKQAVYRVEEEPKEEPHKWPTWHIVATIETDNGNSMELDLNVEACAASDIVEKLLEQATGRAQAREHIIQQKLAIADTIRPTKADGDPGKVRGECFGCSAKFDENGDRISGWDCESCADTPEPKPNKGIDAQTKRKNLMEEANIKLRTRLEELNALTFLTTRQADERDNIKNQLSRSAPKGIDAQTKHIDVENEDG